ncbi:type II toxin-antitoxin system VapC family toxin [Candidatus Woesearchaeota archaeon]|nr:type II toxin-antitoxin system VapC family toxin [Candidatus Woesearchaeota archaeon]
MICLDTDFILDMFKRKENAVLKFHSLKMEEMASTEINYFEVLFGILVKKQISKQEMELAEEFFSSIIMIGLDHSSSMHAAEISAELQKTGQIIELNDTLIAGICLSNNCTILTGNVKHFSRIKGLKVESY